MRSRNATSPLDHIFYALSDPTRREILSALSKGEARLADLAERSDLSLPAVCKHLQVLERGGLIERKDDREDGRAYVLGLRPAAMDKATDWLEKHRQYWNRQFEALEEFLEKNKHKEGEHGSK
jgi:DNA-binding transcriptional ArsR family regulator